LIEHSFIKNAIRVMQVAVDGGALTISVEHSSTTQEETTAEAEKDKKQGRVVHRQERILEYDNRIIRMPDSADMEKVGAQANDGVLTITIPKKQNEILKRRTIAVA
jgi:HSP20 family molecular chaperone IbpA